MLGRGRVSRRGAQRSANSKQECKEATAAAGERGAERSRAAVGHDRCPRDRSRDRARERSRRKEANPRGREREKEKKTAEKEGNVIHSRSIRGLPSSSVSRERARSYVSAVTWITLVDLQRASCRCLFGRVYSRALQERFESGFPSEKALLHFNAPGLYIDRDLERVT